MSESIRNIFCLQMADKVGYMDVLRTSQIEIMPQGSIAGRGLIISSGHTLEFQTALSVCEDDMTRSESIRDILSKETLSYHGPKAMAIPYIPDKPSWSLFKDSLTNIDAGLLPFGYNIELDKTLEADGIDMIFFLLTNILKESSDVVFAGNGAESIIENGFSVETRNNGAYLQGVVSRKKQFLPTIVDTLEG